MAIRTVVLLSSTTTPRDALDPTHDLCKHPVPRAPNGVFFDVDAVRSETVLVIDDDGERDDGRDDRSERCRCRNHKHDDHL